MGDLRCGRFTVPKRYVYHHSSGMRRGAPATAVKCSMCKPVAAFQAMHGLLESTFERDKRDD